MRVIESTVLTVDKRLASIDSHLNTLVWTIASAIAMGVLVQMIQLFQ